MSMLNSTLKPALATLALGAVVVMSGCSSHAALPEPPRNALVAHPIDADATQAEVYSGDVHARYESQLGFRVSGKIKLRLVDVGNHVQAGQPIAELDPLDLQLQVASAQATLSSARANRDLAQSEFDRYQALLEKHFISHTQFDTQNNALKAAKAQVAQAEAALSVAQNQAEYTSLRADHAGVITAINAEAGQVVTAGQPIATLARDGEIEVEIAVSENRIANYKRDMPAIVEPWADASRHLRGHLREISPEADRVTRTYRVRVSLDETDGLPKLGQTARVYFADANDARRELIPLSALHEKSGKPAVWVVDAKTHQVHLVPVGVAAYREQGVVLDGGVDTTQWIVTAGVHKLRDGEAIAPIDAENRPVVL
ncbi:MAG TPA: efflux RND transporter periplasmic adaptor subunit [Rudaea sp.]|nr:efflux RND transporter periplasmic adaptor subunit [Rudaea sp.]